MKQVRRDVVDIDEEPVAKKARRSPSPVPDPTPASDVPASVYFITKADDDGFMGMWRWRTASCGTSAGEMYDFLKEQHAKGDLAQIIDATTDSEERELAPELPDGWEYDELELDVIHCGTGIPHSRRLLEGEPWFFYPSDCMLDNYAV
jgi:hypothetical protein